MPGRVKANWKSLQERKPRPPDGNQRVGLMSGVTHIADRDNATACLAKIKDMGIKSPAKWPPMGGQRGVGSGCVFMSSKV